jgi:hypothetical protein
VRLKEKKDGDKRSATAFRTENENGSDAVERLIHFHPSLIILLLGKGGFNVRHGEFSKAVKRTFSGTMEYNGGDEPEVDERMCSALCTKRLQSSSAAGATSTAK